jgi:hypothetical protein
MYGYMISRTTCGCAISQGSSPLLMIYSNRQRCFDGIPNRPQIDGRLILQMNRKSKGKNSSKTRSGVCPSLQSGKSVWVSGVGKSSFQFMATHHCMYGSLNDEIAIVRRRGILFGIQLPYTLGFEEILSDIADFAIRADQKVGLKIQQGG